MTGFMEAAPDPPRDQTLMKVWVVEDNFVNRELLTLAVRAGGHDVVATGDAAGALGLLSEAPPDLVLLDLSLPDMDGAALMLRLRQEPQLRATRMVAITTYTYRGDRARLLAQGFDRVITKPINTRTLLFDIGIREREEAG